MPAVWPPIPLVRVPAFLRVLLPRTTPALNFRNVFRNFVINGALIRVIATESYMVLAFTPNREACVTLGASDRELEVPGRRPNGEDPLGLGPGISAVARTR